MAIEAAPLRPIDVLVPSAMAEAAAANDPATTIAKEPEVTTANRFAAVTIATTSMTLTQAVTVADRHALRAPAKTPATQTETEAARTASAIATAKAMVQLRAEATATAPMPTQSARQTPATADQRRLSVRCRQQTRSR
ncbi:hypothetical protein ACFJIW_01690 [Tahibacter sp. UC22_41]|uniref:hypothetical protein n=1 Tax=Tahibacter sp. UC22_41 TaxID=3350178 RepID=UPI0036DCD24D